MFDNKIATQPILDSIIIILLSLTYAGISSGIFFGIRVVDILILVALIYKAKTKISSITWILVGLWFVSIAISTIVGFTGKAPYLISDFRFFVIFGLGVLLARSLAKNETINVEYIFYFILIGTLIIYYIIPYLPVIRFYYIPESFQNEEHKNTVFGPSVILLNYLYIYLVFKDRNRHFLFYFSYVAAALLIFNLRISRQDLVIMLLLFAWSIGYRLIYNIKLTYLLIIAVGCIAAVTYLSTTNNDRIRGILDPKKDTSFNYRVISNADFMNKFQRASVTEQAFGFGIGSTFIFHYNEYLGVRILNILDNTPLTILLKSGYLGLLLYLLIVLYPMLYLTWHQRLLLLFPIVLSMFLFNHALYNVLYIFGLYFVAFKLKADRYYKLNQANNPQ